MWLRSALLAVTLLSVATGSSTQSSRSRLEFESLEVVPGVFVQVDGVTAEAARDGLSADSLRMDIEQLLRRNRIRVLTQPQWQTIIGNPALHLVVNLHKFSSRQYIYAASLEVRQLTRLMRDSTKMVFTRTWGSETVLGAARTENLALLRERAAPLVRQFISAYQAAVDRSRRAEQ